MTALLEFFYSKILRREYPLIKISRNGGFDVPYASTIPDSIFLKFTNGTMEEYGITEDSIGDAVIDILTHEYLHLILWRIIEDFKWNDSLNSINRWNVHLQKITWKLWKTKENHEYVWETTDGIQG